MLSYQDITFDKMAELIKFRQTQHTLSMELMNKIKKWNTDMAPILKQYHLIVIEGQKPYQMVNNVIERKIVQVCLDISGDKYNNIMTVEQDQELVKILVEHQLMIVEVKAHKMLIDDCYYIIFRQGKVEWSYKTLTKEELIKDTFPHHHAEIIMIDEYVITYLVTIPKLTKDISKYLDEYEGYYTNKQYELMKTVLSSLINNVSLINCGSLNLGHGGDINRVKSNDFTYNSTEQRELFTLITQTNLNVIKGVDHHVFPGLKDLLPHLFNSMEQ